MGIFSRLARLIKSNINALIDSAEDPIKMLDQIVADMAAQLVEAKKSVAVAIADEKKLAKRAEAEQAKATEWQRRAMLAIRAGDDNLAKEALMRKKEHDTTAAAYKDQWAKQKKQVDALKQALRILNNKIEEAKRKKEILKARAKRTEAQEQINKTMAELSGALGNSDFQRMADKIEEAEARAEANAELQNEFTGDTLEHKFAKMSMVHEADDDLMALKQQMGLAPQPEPEPEKVRLDDEMEEIGDEEAFELASALADLEAEEQAEQARMKR